MKCYEDDFSSKGRGYKERFMKAIKDTSNLTFDYKGRVLLISDPKAKEDLQNIIDVPKHNIPNAYKAKKSTQYEWIKKQANSYFNLNGNGNSGFSESKEL